MSCRFFCVVVLAGSSLFVWLLVSAWSSATTGSVGGCQGWCFCWFFVALLVFLCCVVIVASWAVFWWLLSGSLGAGSAVMGVDTGVCLWVTISICLRHFSAGFAAALLLRLFLSRGLFLWFGVVFKGFLFEPL